MRWDAFATSNTLGKGSEVVIAEPAQVVGELEATLSKGDIWAIEFPNGNRARGVVTEVINNEAIIEVNGVKYTAVKSSSAEPGVLKFSEGIKSQSWVIT